MGLNDPYILQLLSDCKIIYVVTYAKESTKNFNNTIYTYKEKELINLIKELTYFK